MNDASDVVIASVLVISGTTLFRRIREGTWKNHVVEIIVFGFLLLIALLLIAVISPTIAKTLAYLGMIGAFLVNGEEVLKFVGDFGRGKSAI